MWCVPGEVGGSEQYLVRQLLGLDECGEADGVSVYGPPALATANPRLAERFPFVASPVDGRRRWRRMIAESGWLYGQTAATRLVHHGGGTAPARARRPYVLTIHDLQYRTYPHYFSRAKRLYLDAVVPRSATRAAAVLVPSEYVRGTVVEQLGVDADRVRVVPHGYEPALLTDVTPEHELRARYGLGAGPVIVYPAMTAPHKNHRFLLDLMTSAWGPSAGHPSIRRPSMANGASPRLVLLGGHGLAEPEVAARLAHDPALASHVVRPGRVSDADRNGLIALARALVFPSEYEGFGAPVIEAMALGTPVVCSDSTSLPDIAGGAALVLPLDLDAWSGALDEVERRRDELVAAGRERVGAFTARASGRALAASYAAVLD
jgi:glycosyltransferase involved in cell wall biosynthesis